MKKTNTEIEKRHNKEEKTIVTSAGNFGIHHSGSEKRDPWAEALKEFISFTGFLQIDGGHVTQTDYGHTCKCPFNKKWGCSFDIYNDSMAFCSACRWSGDIIQYVMQRHRIGFHKAYKLLMKNAWLARKDAKDYIWNARQVEAYSTVIMCRDEWLASYLTKGRFNARHQTAVIASSWPLDVSEELQRLLSGKKVMLYGYDDDMATEHFSDIVSDVCASVRVAKYNI